MIIQKAFKYRFFPTEAQIIQLAQSFGCARYVYNRALELRTKTYEEEKKSLSYAQTTASLTEWKKEPEKIFLNDVSSVVLQQSLRNLDAAFNNFYDKRASYPKFKSRNNKQSIRYQLNAFTYRDGKIILAKQNEPLNISWSRPLPEDAKFVSATVSKDRAERYFVSILVETNIEPLPAVNAEVGIDVGIKTLATASNGDNLENPRPLNRAIVKLKRSQRGLSRKIKGSKNREKQRKTVARQHARVRDIRLDNIHKYTTRIISENQAIYVETLNVSGMLQNHKLAFHIADASFGEIFRQLEYKAKWCGRIYIQMDQFFPSSKICSNCGHLLKELQLSVREWICPECEYHHERDDNSSKVLLIAGRIQRSIGSDARKVNAYEVREAIRRSA